jgi:ankyrin repeat protein
MAAPTEEERCAEARRFRRVHDAFVAGDMADLRAALGDPDGFPNSREGLALGVPLVYATYWSPLKFVRALLDAGADPNLNDNDGFPPIMAALSMLQETPGANRRADVTEVVTLLLERGSDPNQRGINDYTPLHYLAGLGDVARIRLLLAHGADPSARTRIDDFETPKEIALRAGHTAAAELL